MEFLDNLQQMLQETVPEMIIKYSNTANLNETVESKKAGDRYVSAMMKTDTFNSYQTYTESALISAGFTEAEVKEYRADRTKIPVSRRKYALEAMRNEIINEFEETNNYYRMLAGLPNTNDILEVWLDMEVYAKYGVESCPVHELDRDILITMEIMGDLDNAKALYPDRPYLNYLGIKHLDPSVTRPASNYQILYFPRPSDGEGFYRDFLSTYEECREYFLTVIYNQYYVANYDYYDNCIAFNILIMSINKLIPQALKRYIERDFYDLDTVRIFLEAYGIEYNAVFTMSQLKLVAKNLNILLQSKSTDKVFIDILELLGYSNFSVMKYYLVKQHVMDSDNKPIFYFNTYVDEEGNEHREYDTEHIPYEYHFAKMKVGSYDIQTALHDASNRLEYRHVVATDDYWIEDAELMEKLEKADFNYIETKYMDMNVMYRMHAILFETVYLTRIVLDKRSETRSIYVTLPTITPDDIALFDVFILLICLLCKYYGMEPDLLKSPSKILHIMGFNFNADFAAIREEISKRADLDDRLLKYIKTTTFSSPQDVNNMYVNVYELEALLVRLRNESETHETYAAYDKLYRTLMWSELNNEIYALRDGTIPDKFTDYLIDANVSLYNYYDSINGTEDVSKSINYITSKLMNLFTDAKYLNYIKVLDTAQLDAILKLLCFFKSYTVMMRDTNLILRLDSRYYNMIHLSTYCNFSGDGPTKLYIPDTSLLDFIVEGITKIRTRGTIKGSFKVDPYTKFFIHNILKLEGVFDFKTFYKLDMTMIENFLVNGGINCLTVDEKIIRKMCVEDKNKWLLDLFDDHELIPLSIKLVKESAILKIFKEIHFGEVPVYICSMLYEDPMNLSAEIDQMLAKIYQDYTFDFRIEQSMTQEQNMQDELNAFDGVDVTSIGWTVKSTVSMKDGYYMMFRLRRRDRVTFEDFLRAEVFGYIADKLHVTEEPHMVEKIGSSERWYTQDETEYGEKTLKPKEPVNVGHELTNTEESMTVVGNDIMTISKGKLSNQILTKADRMSTRDACTFIWE